MILSRNTEASLSGSSASGRSSESGSTASDEFHDGDYEAPMVADLGDVRQVTLGSSSSGNADANSQYYW
ncbi:lasso RiPP family leader peptide-containing protein [Streptomyces sp. 8N706]|uniref:lasso RiPP family leader peptide-containing protein n=1 Tax=Streptomyces sp. 8N706 TaxID=3457416 RepID=UPI003FD5A4E5